MFSSSFETTDVTFLGSGIGRYSHSIFLTGSTLAITDQQYLRILYETGYLGCLGYGFISLAIILRGLKNLKNNLFELSVIIFFLIAMMGANCLSQFDMHTAIFWLCCGRIYNNYRNCIN